MTTWLLAVIQMGTQKVLWGAMGLEVQILYKFNSEEVLASKGGNLMRTSRCLYTGTFKPVLLSILIFLLFVPLQLSTAASMTISNPTPITVAADPDNPVPGSPYPSTINVSGLTGVIVNVEVTLYGVSHNRPDDLDVLLVGPHSSGGLASAMIMSDAGDTQPISGVNLTFSDTAGSLLPDSGMIATGTYRPTDYDQDAGFGNSNDGNDESFTGLPVSPPYGTSLSVFNLANPNAAWKLYVFDDRPNRMGSIAGGWSITITTNESPIANDDGVFTTAVDTPLTIPASAVLANDSDPENNLLVPILVGGAANGTVVQNPDDSFTYTPNPGYSGPDSFTYKVTDDFSESNVATVRIEVGGTNNNPVVNAGADQTGIAGTPVSITATYTDADPDDTHTASINWGDGSPIENVPAAGGVVNGTHTYSTGGTFTVTVTVVDSQGGVGSDSLLMTIDGPTPEVSPTPDVPQPTPTMAPATPLPLLTDYNGVNIDDVLRSDVPLEIRYGIFARLLMRNGRLIRNVNVGMIGNQALLDMGIRHAVDIFTVDGVSMAAGVRVCFDGNGSLYFLDSAEAPRVPHLLDSTRIDGRTCAWIFGPGTVVMVNVERQETPEPGTLTDCQITTLYRMNVREEPSLDSDILTRVPAGMTLTAVDRTEDWFRVIIGEDDGWIAALYVNPSRNCG